MDSSQRPLPTNRKLSSIFVLVFKILPKTETFCRRPKFFAKNQKNIQKNSEA